MDLNLHLAIFYHRVDNGQDLSTSGHLPYPSTLYLQKSYTFTSTKSSMLHISGLFIYQMLNYFVIYLTYYSHSTGTTQWVDPRLAQVKKATVDECGDDGKGTTAI